MSELKKLLGHKPRLWLAVAESLTGGQVQALIAAESGASNYFSGGITAYNLEQKVQHLGVDRKAAARVNCVSAEIAGQMARGVCELFGANVGLATTGYAEPASGLGATEPFAWWAIAYRRPRQKFLLRHGRIECPGAKRVEVQMIVAQATLAELESFLREIRST